MFNPNTNFNPWQLNQPHVPGQGQSQTPLIIDSDSEDEEHPQPTYSRRQHAPGPHRSSLSPAYTPLPLEQEKKIRSRLREERHAALCVLMDRELLTIQSLAAQETLPQTRRRFLANLLSPSDPTTAAAIRADKYTIQRPASSSPSANTEPILVSRPVVDVCESDDSGWYKPEPERERERESVSEIEAASPAGSARMKGRDTPERRVKGRVSSGRQQQGTRERRRRWSGVERQDYGAEASF